ncbi:MAG: TIGR00270 family protein [Candidatus Lokiarchaeota archaeon]|nr:TIGR00270 family protein [Candidatus Lokiarchaeota archaeon]
MPKPTSIKNDKECQICGSIIWGKGQRVILEGARITVCHNCAQHGTKIHEPSSYTYGKKPIKKKPYSVPKRQTKNPATIEELEIVSDYARRVRNARNNFKLNQDQFAQKLNEKPSLIRRIETGKAVPTVKLAKKIQKIYKIQLLTKSDEMDYNDQEKKFMKKVSGSSLGDIAFIKKKQKD